jgi:guanylate kinase
VGKGTVVSALHERLGDVVVSVSATTRPPRPGEIPGRHYHFLSEEEFSALVAAEGFLEWAQFGGYRYGTPWSSVSAPLDGCHAVLLEIDVQGALQVKRRFPSATLVFIAPPSVAALEARLRSRGTDSAERIQQRLLIAEREMAAAAGFDAVVVNDELNAAVAALARILQG